MIRSAVDTPTTPAPLLLRAAEAAELLGVSERALWRGAGDGTYPAPVRLPGRVTRWRYADLRRWTEELAT